MHRLFSRIKKAIFYCTAAAMAAALFTPAAALAAEPGTQTVETSAQSTEDEARSNPQAAAPKEQIRIENHTGGRSDVQAVSGIVISDVSAPVPGSLLDDTAVVTTAQDVTWEIPVLWIDEYLLPDIGLAGDGAYLPVLAFVVPEEYSLENDPDGSGCTVRLEEDLFKLFGDSKILSIYEEKTQITYILPADLKELFAKERRGSSASSAPDVAEDPIPEEEVAPLTEDGGKEPEKPAPEEPQEDEPQAEVDRHLINLHCDEKAQNALSDEDLSFLADLLINKLQPQAVNLLAERFPSFNEAADNNELGKYTNLVITYNENSWTYGNAQCGWTVDNTYPDYKFCYKLTIEASQLVALGSDSRPKVIRDFDSEEMTTLANTVVHEIFHMIMYDYNRPGMTGKRMTAEGTLTQEPGRDDILFPIWFREGSASCVENNWQERENAIAFLRKNRETNAYMSYYDMNVLLDNYVNGCREVVNGSPISLFCYDLQCCGGTDLNGEACDTVANRYVSGYLATLYLSELAARSSGIGSSLSTEDSHVTVNSEKLRLGLDSILSRMHSGETLDDVIGSISDYAYSGADDFEARFIKGDLVDGTYTGESGSLAFVSDFMNYMREIDMAQGRDNALANGSILFDFDLDYAAPLDFETEETARVLQVLDADNENFINYVRSTVPESQASATGGKSVSGESPSESAQSASGTSSAPAEDTGSEQQAAKYSESSDQVSDSSDEQEASSAQADDLLEESAAQEDDLLAESAEQNCPDAPSENDN